MYLRVILFLYSQEQGFEDIPEQQQFFDEGKWALIIFRS
jgi:hypothetical protein